MLGSRPVPLGIDSHIYRSKTPARMKSRIENSHPATIHKNVKDALSQVHPATLNPQKLFKDPSASQFKPTIVTTRVRPLGDKTPFPNRIETQRLHTPLPLSFLGPGAIQDLNKIPGTLLRPSSTRKHVRVPRSTNKNFETPLNSGNYWDVSETSIVIPEVQAAELTAGDDYDEVEYMPPNNLSLVYQPPLDIDLPNYKEVGVMLSKLAHSCPYDNTPGIDIVVDEDDCIGVMAWDMLELPELGNEDPFESTKSLQRLNAPKCATSAKVVSSRIRARRILAPEHTSLIRASSVAFTAAGPSVKTSRVVPPGKFASMTGPRVTLKPGSSGAHPSKAKPAPGGRSSSSSRQDCDKITLNKISKVKPVRKILASHTNPMNTVAPPVLAIDRDRVGKNASASARRPLAPTSAYRPATASRSVRSLEAVIVDDNNSVVISAQPGVEEYMFEI